MICDRSLGSEGHFPRQIRFLSSRTETANNALYRGELVWNRQRFIKDPITGKRQVRLNPETECVTKDVPHLRIIDEGLWLAVKDRKQEAERPHGGVSDGVWKSREARALGLKMAPSNLYRLLTCAQCDGEFCNVGGIVTAVRSITGERLARMVGRPSEE